MQQLQYSKVNNAIITLGDTDDSGKGKHFKSRFIQPGLAGYPGQFGNALIKKENLDKFVWTLRAKPVIINHKDKIKDKDKVGIVNNVWFNPEDGWYWCDGIIFDDEAINLINNGWSVSCAYDFTKADNSGGTENNIPYDIEFLDGEFNHLALVDNPRYGGANIVFNSKNSVFNWLNKEEIGRWITTKDGVKIPIKKGLSVKEGLKDFAKTHVEKQKEKNAKKDEAYTILAGALGKDKNYLKQNLKKSKKIQEELEKLKTDDTLKTAVSFDDLKYYNLQGIKEDSTKAQEELISKALDDIMTDNFSNYADGEYDAEYGKYLLETEKKLNEGYEKIIEQYKENKDWAKAEEKLAELYGFDEIEDFRDDEKLSKFYQDLAEVTVDEGKYTKDKQPNEEDEIKRLIESADSVSMFDSGSVEKRLNDKAIKELNNLAISEGKKQETLKQLKELHKEILKKLANAPSEYKVGPSEFNKRVGYKKSGDNLDKAYGLQAQRDNIIKQLEEEIRKEKTKQENISLGEKAKDAISKGLMEFEHNGEIWFRTSKRSKSYIGLDKYSQSKYDKMKAQNSLTDTILNAIAELITGE